MKSKCSLSCLTHFSVVDSIKTFLNEFCYESDEGRKVFKYAAQLTQLAHREQTALTIELDDLNEFNDNLVEAVMHNTRRYTKLFSDVVSELLPSYKERTIVAKDSLDVYIEHRLLMESRMRHQHETRDPNNQFPTELMKRL